MAYVPRDNCAGSCFRCGEVNREAYTMIRLEQPDLKRALERARDKPETAIDSPIWVHIQSDYPGVVLPARVLAQYPTSIIVVLQYRFWELEVGDNEFSFGTSFNRLKTHVTVPWEAVLGAQRGQVQEQQTLKPEPETPAKVVSLADYRKK